MKKGKIGFFEAAVYVFLGSAILAAFLAVGINSYLSPVSFSSQVLRLFSLIFAAAVIALVALAVFAAKTQIARGVSAFARMIIWPFTFVRKVVAIVNYLYYRKVI